LREWCSFLRSARSILRPLSSFLSLKRSSFKVYICFSRDFSPDSSSLFYLRDLSISFFAYLLSYSSFLIDCISIYLMRISYCFSTVASFSIIDFNSLLFYLASDSSCSFCRLNIESYFLSESP
jgi:hypothetical protein